MKRERLNKFSIRKLTVGAASVLIGVAFGATTVSATEQPVQPAGHTVNPADPKKDTPADPKKDTPADPKKDNPSLDLLEYP
ncbi:MAG: YSIRK-type signal peptide-containing protein, partial [Lactobacillus iners]|nr:YSIRK-type signal peptide-containing protein [Lactobacillus iners]